MLPDENNCHPVYDKEVGAEDNGRDSAVGEEDHGNGGVRGDLSSE
jgi:hypothetical protein